LTKQQTNQGFFNAGCIGEDEKLCYCFLKQDTPTIVWSNCRRVLLFCIENGTKINRLKSEHIVSLHRLRIKKETQEVQVNLYIYMWTNVYKILPKFLQ